MNVKENSFTDAQRFYLRWFCVWGGLAPAAAGAAGADACLLCGGGAALLALCRRERGRGGMRRALELGAALGGWLSAALTLRETMAFLPLIGLDGAPRWAGPLALALLLWRLVAAEEAALGRLAWLLFFPAAACALLALLPMLSALRLPAAPPSGAAWRAAGGGAALRLLLPFPALLCALGAPEKSRGAPALAALAAGAAPAALLALGTGAILGGPLSAVLRFPAWFALAARAPRALPHPEALLAAAWTLALPVRAALPLRLANTLLRARRPRGARLWPALLPGLALLCALAA